MKKINIVKKNTEFSRIIGLKKAYSNKCFVVNYDVNSDNIPKFGISVSKKVGNAVVRNKNKRQVKNIIDTNKKVYQNNLNYIIIVRQGAVLASYQEKEQALIELFNKIKEKCNEENK